MDVPVPDAKVGMDPLFEGQITALKLQAKAEYEQRIQGGQVQWLRPINWDGNTLTPDSMVAPFDPVVVNAQFRAAILNSAQPGNTGDDQIAVMMAETLSGLERSLRVRHTMSGPRAIAQATARRRGHGRDRGSLVTCYLEYVRRALTQARGDKV